MTNPSQDLSPNSTFLADEEATENFGNALSSITNGKGVLTLSGDLGTGKTTLSRGLIRALGHTGAVKSPTYTIVEPYEIGPYRVMHYDLYRLEDPEELEFLGMRDFLDDQTLSLIEWPEKAGALLPAVDLAVILSVVDRGRNVSWEAKSSYGETLSKLLADRYS